MAQPSHESECVVEDTHGKLYLKIDKANYGVPKDMGNIADAIWTNGRGKRLKNLPMPMWLQSN